MQISVEINDGIAVIRISGKMIFDPTLFHLREHIQEQLQSGIRRFILELAEVPHIDSSGCGELIRVDSSIVREKGVVAFVGLTERVRNIWDRIKLHQVFHTFETAEEAKKFLLQRAASAG
jgi:anti-anti-sigma factor